MITIDHLSYRSKLRYVNASEKFIYAVVTLVLCVASRSILVSLIVLALNAVLTLGLGGIPYPRYRKLMLIPLGFLILSTIAIIVNISKTPLDAYAFAVGSYYITGSRASLWLAARLILTALASVSCLYFLSLNTTMVDIQLVMHKMHFPMLIREMMLLIYRFIFLLMAVSKNITTAQHSRLGNKDFKTSVRSFGTMVSVLLVLSVKRANEMYDAMESRCYEGNIRVLEENYAPKTNEIMAILLCESLLCVLSVCVRIY